MDLEGIMLSERTERQILYGFTYTWNLKKKKNQGNKVEWWLAGTGGGGNDNGQTVQAFDKFWASNYLQNKKEMSFWPPRTSLI